MEKNHLELKKTNLQDMSSNIEDLQKKQSAERSTLRAAFSLKEDSASNEEIRNRLLSGGKITGTNLIVMIAAVIIASVGLNTNSVAVIIGAMLISPLMGSILAIAYGTASNDAEVVKQHLVGFALQIVFSVASATIYFLLSPAKEATEQLLARTSPTFFDVLIAIAGGVAGIVGQTRQDKANNIIPGVAIATALMPPLCTCGYSIANANWHMLLGATYLFIINAYFIYATSSVVLALLGTPLVKELTARERCQKIRKMRRNTLLVLIPVIAITIYMIESGTLL